MRVATLLPCLVLLLTATTARGAGVWVPAGPEGGPVVASSPAAPSVAYAIDASTVYRSEDGGVSWDPAHTFSDFLLRIWAQPDDPQVLFIAGRLLLPFSEDPTYLFRSADGGESWETVRGGGEVGADTSPCVADAVTLCLQDGRFEVRVSWQDFQGGAGEGQAIPLTSDTGAFWFFRDSNLELAVKVLDGTGVNGFWWNFYGSLSNVPFTLAIRDSVTGDLRTYANPPRVFASRGDTRGFRDAAPAGGALRRAGTTSAPVRFEPSGAPGDLWRLLYSPAGTPAGAPAWTRLGPDGGPVEALRIAADEPAVAYAGSAGSGIFRSQDGAASWSDLEAVRERPGERVLAIEEGPDGDLYVLYWGGPIHRSRDGGETWSVLDTGFILNNKLAADPLSPGVLFAASQWFTGGVRRSDDGGETWDLLGEFPRELDPPQDFLVAEDLTFDAAGDTLWAATSRGVYRSADGGESWIPAGTAYLPYEIQALAAVPGAPGHLYALTGAGSIYETLDGGDSWIWKGPYQLPGQAPEVAKLTVDPADPGHLWAITGELLEASADGGQTWEPVAQLPGPVYDLDPDPRGNGVVLAATGSGVQRSADGGDTWETATSGLHARNVVGLDARPDARDRLLAADGSGVFRSADAGENWSRVLESDSLYLASGASDPSMIYAAGGDRIHRSRDGGSTWEPAATSDSDFRLQGIWVDPDDADVAFAAAVTTLQVDPPFARLSRTLDGGETWETVASVGGGVPDLAIGPGGPGQPSVVLISETIWRIHRSTDGGATFEPVAGDGLPAFRTMVALAADPLQPGRFLGSLAGEGLWETVDGGDTWRPFGDGLPTGTSLRLLFRPDDPTVVYAAASGLGVFRSADRGATWTEIGGGGPDGSPTGRLTLGLTGAPLRLYATTERGVWSVPATSPTSPCIAGPTTLCLQDGRFRVEVEWQDFEGGSGPGHSHPLTGDTGAFWFFDDDNLELFVKVLDGTPVNGRFWVFYGSLSNVAFTLTVTNTETGEPRIYDNPARVFASRGDTTAF